jgi:GntR family transcriptional regulator / MocR family aminotransferase
MLIQLAGSEPLYQQIYEALKQKVLTGELQRGTKMPSSRTLANDLCVSRNIVLIAYDQLIAEGYVESRQGSGTYVAAIPDDFLNSKATPRLLKPDLPVAPRLSSYAERIGTTFLQLARRAVPRPSVKYNFRYGHTAIDLLDQRVWRRLIAHRTIRSFKAGAFYSEPQGQPELREALAQYLRIHRGVQCEAGQIVIVNGSQQAIDLISRILVNPGDAVVVEEPCYPGTRLSLAALGANIHPIRVDDNGLVTEELQSIPQPVRLICVTPSHQYPTGSIMQLQRRLELIAFARKAGAFILEDDYDSEFRYDARPEKAVQGLDPDGRVLYVSTFSKVLFAGLRLGYIVLPKILVDPLTCAKALSDRNTAVFAQGVLADFMREGHFERHLRRVRLKVGERRSSLIEALTTSFRDNVKIVGENAGVHLLAWLPDVSREALPAWLERAEQIGVATYPVEPCYVKPPRIAGIVLGYASLQPQDIHDGVRLLAKALRSSCSERTGTIR